MNKKDSVGKMTTKKWVGFDLSVMEAKHLKSFCLKNNIDYEVDDSDALIHIDVHVNLLQETNVKSFLLGINVCYDELYGLPF